MQTPLVTHARIAVPADCFDLVTALVTRLGGQVTADSSDDVVTMSPMSEAERMGRMLKGLRLRAEMTQKALAAAIDVPQGHISEYESNKRPIPAAKAALLAQVLNTVPEHFLSRSGN